MVKETGLRIVCVYPLRMELFSIIDDHFVFGLLQTAHSWANVFVLLCVRMRRG